MRKLWVVVVLLAVVCLSSGCRTLIVGTTQEINITSKPSGARVEILGPKAPVPVTAIAGGVSYIQARQKWVALGVTPIQTQLNRGQNYTIKLTKAGYKEKTVHLNRSLTAGFWIGNLFGLPIIGHLMDWASGAGFTLRPGDHDVTLQKAR